VGELRAAVGKTVFNKNIKIYIKNVVKSIFIRTFVSSKVPLSDKEKWGF
jgi:hypothetical protein